MTHISQLTAHLLSNSIARAVLRQTGTRPLTASEERAAAHLVSLSRERGVLSVLRVAAVAIRAVLHKQQTSQQDRPAFSSPRAGRGVRAPAGAVLLTAPIHSSKGQQE